MKKSTMIIVTIIFINCGGENNQPCATGDCQPTDEVYSSSEPQTSKPTCTPSAEVCDGKDNDCDGEVDEGCSDPSLTQPETPTTPACKPSEEICDGRDNDCDGEVDEDDPLLDARCVESMGPKGVPQAGTLQCLSIDDNPLRKVVSCEVLCADEVCDGVDNNCDGVVDEGCNNPPPTTQPPVCTPSTEVCDGVDNDCDGQVDEDDPKKGQECTKMVITDEAEKILWPGQKECIAGKMECQLY